MMDARFEKVGIPVKENAEADTPVIDLTKKTRARAECRLEMTCRIKNCLFGGSAGPTSGDTEATCLADDLKRINLVLGEACLQLEMMQKQLGM